METNRNRSFQLHKLEYVPTRPSELYQDNCCLFSKDAKVSSVPTLHLYGRTRDGSSVCAKIRNIYPYFYVELPPSPTKPEEEYICQIGAGIDFALTGLNDPSKSLVHRIDLVQARLLYHYSEHPTAFLRISLYSPYNVKKAAEAFQTGRIGGTQMRCYEAHIPFILQFMIDHNLFGMETVVLEDVNIIQNDDTDRATSCDIEMECSASQIKNQEKLGRFGQLRDEAKGLFPSFHVMPSIVAMLENLGLGTAPAASQARPSQDLASMNCIPRYKELVSKLFVREGSSEKIDWIEGLPKAYSYSTHDDMIPRLESSCWDRFSFGFSSQQIQRASLGFKSEPASQRPIPMPSQLGQFEEVEDILEEMLRQQGESQSEEEIMNYSIPQVDGSGDVMDMWSDNSYETDSGLGLGDFSEADVKDNKTFFYQNVAIPPRTADLLESLRRHKVPRQVHQKPFDGTAEPKVLSNTGGVRIVPASCPPLTYSEANDWIRKETNDKANDATKRIHESKQQAYLSQIDGPTQKFSMGFDPDAPSSSQLSSNDNLSILSVECFGDSQGAFLSNPEHNSILMVAWSFLSSNGGQEINLDGTILVHSCFRSPRCKTVQSEEDLFEALIQLVNDLDPDIICGYEIESLSWGHLQDRSLRLGKNLSRSISRSLARRRLDPNGRPDSEDPYASKLTSTFQVHGRICLNLWRVMRSEVSGLRSYSFEHVAFQVLHQNYPKYRQPLLKAFFYGEERLARPDILSRYLLVRSRGNIELLIKTEILNRTCEFARLYGVDFFSVLSRGSQYKVESLLIRLARLENFLAYSPSRPDVVRMAAPEALPLVMEPMSEFYTDPVVVLDFQALYPSIVIAYNYCYTTCLGRVDEAPFPKIFGANFLQTGPPKLPEPEDEVIVAPNRVAFVGKSVREGLLPKLLSELLEARMAVKTELANESDPMRKKILDARQLGLKLISNVTYGYTSAAFSGRMPSIEIADSIVLTGRATLEQSVRWIHDNPEWNAKVVYGDTDSLFIKLPGRTLVEAHRVGREIAAWISVRCPSPVKLKFEKVYLPCFLMSKKRYIGFKYEKPGPKSMEPIFDAKGIETVRRDSCPLVSKVLERTLKIMARTKDIQQVRTYVQRQFQKVLAGGKHNLSDFVFSKEVRLGTYAADRKVAAAENDDDEQDMDVEAGQRPHSAIIALQRIQQDPRDVAQYGERIPYVIVYGQGGDRLRELVASPDELIINPNLRINAVYYIVKCLIPALNRPLGLIPGIDVAQWYASLPRPTSRPLSAAAFVRLGKTRTIQSIDSFFKPSACLVCGGRDAHELSKNGGSVRLCRGCSSADRRPEVAADLLYRLKAIEADLNNFHEFNVHHTGHADGPVTDLQVADARRVEMCWSYDCHIFWRAISLRQNEVQHRSTILSALRALNINL